jgi:3-oxoacyl-[acyl-carrier protein] reductase
MAPERVALVTGAARGIGRAIAVDLARDHGVAISHLSTAPEGLPENILAVTCDLTEAGAAERLVTETLARFGRLDVIVNNAGVVSGSPAEGAEADALRAMLDLNLLAPARILAAALPHLKAGAAIVSLSSVNAVLPPQGAAMFGASKAGLQLWTRGMAKELGPRGIRVNGVSPGAIETEDRPRPADLTRRFVEMTALGRVGTPADIAAAVRFLVSDASSFITGEVLTVSGGYRL